MSELLAFWNQFNLRPEDFGPRYPFIDWLEEQEARIDIPADLRRTYSVVRCGQQFQVRNQRWPARVRSGGGGYVFYRDGCTDDGRFSNSTPIPRSCWLPHTIFDSFYQVAGGLPDTRIHSNQVPYVEWALALGIDYAAWDQDKRTRGADIADGQGLSADEADQVADQLRDQEPYIAPRPPQESQ